MLRTFARIDLWCADQSIQLGEESELVEILLLFGRDMAVFQGCVHQIRPGEICKIEHEGGVSDLERNGREVETVHSKS
jgi:hypothetical protein